MTDSKQKRLDQIFMALADASRREMVRLLADKELTMNELSGHFDMSLAAVSKHVKVLEKAGLINRRQEGRTHNLSLASEPLGAALDWISIYRNFWQKRLDGLTTLIEQEDE
ncbi:MAG: metalloregulator ArsR/SmtB family transcription factor [Kangiellaceae bacterium]|nr:metalloregulator ArsR/SmtB family transcription factor [Kangiellaceae bacterium]MCW9016349.1 metalloregulator ArsR/SmtB family transcription factor [Kangiellaceae bacterium]